MSRASPSARDVPEGCLSSRVLDDKNTDIIKVTGDAFAHKCCGVVSDCKASDKRFVLLFWNVPDKDGLSNPQAVF